jgi:hypothetical protein
MNGFTYNFPSGTPTTIFYPSILFMHLNPLFIDAVVGAWDTITVNYVIPSVGNRTSPYNAYYLSGGSVSTTTLSESSVFATPNWQVVFNTDFRNDYGNDAADGPTAGYCSCHTSRTTGDTYCINSTHAGCQNGCKNGNFSTGCNFIQRWVSAILD